MNAEEKEKAKQIEAELIKLTDSFCEAELNAEYAQLCQKVIKKLGRKKTVPFLTGQKPIWAAAVVHAICSANFAFDKSQTPHTSVDEINTFFNTKKSTVSSKSAEIRKMLKIDYFNHEFVLNELWDKNPINNMVMVNGMIVHVDALPEGIREVVKEQLKKGKPVSLTITK
ncbi:MAG: DUF6398 domain-containing protein [Microscillaceae bacterium]|jgi:hypothetical protein|nr:DUF6398 domain-containing protein [Microscillaceae bacterium]